LDGPAHIQAFTIKNYSIEVWHIHGKALTFFSASDFASTETLIIYVMKHPYYTKEIILLARHNHWLSEKQIELLECMDMMK